MNKRVQRQVKTIVPLIISVILIVILAGYAPWGEVIDGISDLSIESVAALIGLSALYYVLKVIRFWYMLKAMKIHQPLPIVALSYMSAQPVTLLPAGEIYRSHSLHRHTGVPISESLPQFTMQGLFEAAGLSIVGVACALSLGILRIPALILAVFVATLLIGIQMGLLKPALHQLNRIPFINLSTEKLERFSDNNRAMLSGKWFPILLGFSILTEIVGGAVAYVAVAGLSAHINIFQAGLVYIVPLVASFVSFLPGGLGVSEQSAVGILLLSGVSVAIAVAATLIMRITIVGGGVAFGVASLGISRIHLKRKS